jgi:pyrimidine-nucleoside phosphorylase
MRFLATEIIKKKQAGGILSIDEISYFINGYTRGEIPDYQMAALLMAIYFKSMNQEETFSLTKVMLRSGEVLDLSFIPEFKVDKHSTGGVGDKTSLILGPIVAAAGLAVPMISGRGLGHTGGTLDKLEAIPGFRTQLSLDDFKKNVSKSKICFIGQTNEICPADKKIYALRDVTGTVESLPLICASIMSKKLAEGIDGLVLDVKFGSGAFMKTPAAAEELALNLMAIAQKYDKKVQALITNMDRPLGRFAGNSLEVDECVAILKGDAKIAPDTLELSLRISAHMLFLGGVVTKEETGFALAKKVLESGRAYEKFEELCHIHGGDITKVPKAKNRINILAPSSGYITKMNTEQLGLAGIQIHAGRSKFDDIIEPTAGLEFHKKTGEQIGKGDLMVTLYGADESLLKMARSRVTEAIEIGSTCPQLQPLVLKVLR